MRRRTFALIVASVFLVICCLAMSGCYATVYSDVEHEDMTNTRELGQTVRVDYSFNMINVYKKGPYVLDVTPIGIVDGVSRSGAPTSYVEIAYRVISTDDGNAADFANCTVVTNLLDAELNPVDYTTWCSDREGTAMNATGGTLEVGRDYTFYVPLRRPFAESGLCYIAVSDRSGYYDRCGSTYWYRIA